LNFSINKDQHLQGFPIALKNEKITFKDFQGLVATFDHTTHNSTVYQPNSPKKCDTNCSSRTNLEKLAKW